MSVVEVDWTNQLFATHTWPLRAKSCHHQGLASVLRHLHRVLKAAAETQTIA
jgi:hypothetical protein